ncbi:hypothetical protein F53441_11529 [Fusarium austroafricanum]|uniref:DUF7580 domain-containing protein n=1 Tax=Fusarium austroafricanum TaxID=2364996 RepID=A0A8H4NPV2_9HYPO|nr:hypothetical protein F53441_11529 [Fusarium austroafricanum]
MSGFEIVGVVLGVLPLIQETAKGLHGVFSDAQTWWQFEREFETFIATLETEHIKFSQNLEILLAELDISDEDRDKLQNDSTCTLWYSAHVQAQLQQRIQKQYYSWFMRQMHDMNTALNSLHEILRQGKVCFFSDSSNSRPWTNMAPQKVYDLDRKSLESELFRLRTSFSHSKDYLITKVTQINDAIYGFLERASKVPSSTASGRRKGATSKPSLGAKSAANSFYECLQTQLKCCCQSSHACGVTVSKDNGGRDKLQMMILFREADTRTQIKIESVFEAAAIPESAPSKLDEVALMKQNVSMKNRAEDIRKKSSKSIFVLAASSLSRPSDRLNLPDPKDPLKKPSRRSRFRKSVSSFIGSKEEETATQDQQVTVAKPQRAVRFAAPDPAAEKSFTVKTNARVPLIHDLCTSISGEPLQSSLGYFHETADNRLLVGLDPADQNIIQQHEIETIEHFLKTTPRRDIRIKVGYDLALAIVNLGGSPWVPRSWNKTDLFLVRNPTDPSPQPFLSHTSLKKTLVGEMQTSAAKKARSILFSLGVLLLELVFREKLESQPFRERLMGTDGKPNEETDFATALLWQQRVEEEFGDELADAIKRCLVCMFDLAPAPDLNSSAFVQAVWQQVLLPVDKFLSAWRRA